MIQKYFPRDKNYLLKEAQDSTKSSLLFYLLSSVKDAYSQKFNPLGLDDPISQKVKRSRKHHLDCLDEFYDSLAAVYRFKYGENQLQFLFDGRTHIEKYSEDWTETFCDWIREFCSHENFILVPNNIENPKIISAAHIKIANANAYSIKNSNEKVSHPNQFLIRNAKAPFSKYSSNL